MICSLLVPLDTVEADVNNHVIDTEKETVPALQREREIVEERTAKSQVFQQEDGSYRMEISAEPIHVKDQKTKKWEPIDNTLIKKETGRFHNKKNLFDVSFTPTTENKEPLVAIDQQGKTVEIESFVQNENQTSSVSAIVEENQVTYKDIYPNTDLSYTVGNGKIKEDIILKEQPGDKKPLEYSFQFDIEGFTLESTEDGCFFLIDSSTNKRMFAIEKPFMMDSSIPDGFVSNMESAMPEGSWSDKIEMEAKQEGNKLLISLKPDMDWLQSEERVYPVIIDPTVKVYQPKNELNDTTIRSALPDTTGGADLELGAGFYSTGNNIVRSLLQFDVGTLPKGSKIMNAQLNLRLSSVWNDTASNIQLYEMSSAWEENRATWNRRTLSALWGTKGGDMSTGLLSSQTVAALDTTVAEPQLFKFAINADTVQKWMNQPSQNLGLMLKASDETKATYKKFYSGDNSGKLEYSPKLTITYFPLSRLGLEDYWSYSEHALTDGQGYVNLGTGNLVLDYTDFVVTGRGSSGFSLNRTYNSKAVEDSEIGYGWSFTGKESVAEFPNRDVIYTQSDGTVHTFKYDVVAAKYNSPAGLYLTLTKANTDAFVITDYNGNRVVYRDLINNPENQGRIYPIDYEEDRNKNKITYLRQTDGTLTGIMDASGRTLTLEYYNSRIISTSFEGTKKSAYTYDENGRLKTSTIFNDSKAVTGSVTTYSYNENGELAGVMDANNQTTIYTYTNGFLENVTEPSIAQTGLSDTTYTYDIANYQASEFDALGKETKYMINTNYIVTSITDPMLFTSSYTHDSNYNLLSSKDPKGNQTINTYDTKGNLLTNKDELGYQTTYTYNEFSQPLTVSDVDGSLTYGYNSYGDVTSEKNSLNEITSYTCYEPYGNLKSMTLPDLTTEKYEFDLNKNYQIQQLDALNRETSAVNDKYGNVTNVTNAKGYGVDFEYDEQNLLKSTTNEKETQTKYGYDENGNLITISNGLNIETKLGYNNQNQFVSRTEPLLQTTTYKYDVLGNIVEEKNPKNVLIKTVYDFNSRPTDILIDGNLKWHYDYDKNGNTTSIKNGETGAFSTLVYDGADKLKSESYGQQKIEYTYSHTETLTDIKGTSNATSFIQKFSFDTEDQLKNIYRNGAVQTSYDYKVTGAPEQRRYVNGVHSTYE